MFFKMNMGIVLLDFSLIFKIFCKSLVNKKNSRLKTKRSHFWPVPPEIYFQDWKSSECKLILKMVPQSIYWKQCLCQHLPAFLGDRGGSGWAVVSLSTSCSSAKARIWKGCRERSPHSARVGEKSPEALKGENCPGWSHQLFCLDFIFRVGRHASGEKRNSSTSHLKLSKILNRFLNIDTTLGEGSPIEPGFLVKHETHLPI